MSAVKDFFGEGDLIDVVSGGEADFLDLFGRRGGKDAKDAAAQQEAAGLRAIEEFRLAREQGQGFLDPFAQVAQQGIDRAGFLTDPQQQFDFLQSNPLFQLALENANQQTLAQGAAGGRLQAGDTLTDLSNNVLLSASPLIDRQRQDIRGLLDLGFGTAQTQANTALGVGSNVAGLLTDIGAVQAGGTVGASNARSQGVENVLGIAGAVAPFFSDSRLKSNSEIVGKENGYDIWKWTWNKEAFDKFGLDGESRGVMFVDVQEKNPEAASYQDGYGKVNYAMIGITPGV